VGGIFISYRRDDTAHSAGRLYERLARDFPRSQLLMDVDAIELGLDFFKVLDEQVSGCDVLLALIGPNWVDAKTEKGVRRLDDPDDFVRIEIAAALERDIRVIPVLVDGAPMPRAEELPEPLKPLARRNAIWVSHEGFGADTQRLVEVLQRVTRPAAPERRGFFERLANPPPEQRPVLPKSKSPPADQHQDKSVGRAGISGKDRLLLVVAGTLGVGGVPITIAIGALFVNSGWSFPTRHPLPSGIAAGAMLVVVTVVAQLIPRGRRVHAAEFALYWLGSTSAVAFAMGPLFSERQWYWYWFEAQSGRFPPGMVSGWLVGAILGRVVS
jgi:hypothetical protein